MVQITKLNGEVIQLSVGQLEHIAFCPEIKVVLTSGENFFVKEVLLRKNGKKRGEQTMIQLTKLNGEVFLLNEEQVKYISFIPETKVFMMSDDYYLVKESGFTVKWIFPRSLVL